MSRISRGRGRIDRLPLLLLLLLPFQQPSYRVTRVIDGDTIEIQVAGRRERVRYIGIDTPELTDPRPAVRRLALDAAGANAKLLSGRRVTLEFDVEERDRYGRLLSYVWIGDTLVNERLVRAGYARAFTYPPNVRYADRFRAAERAARGEGRGLWQGLPREEREPGGQERAAGQKREFHGQVQRLEGQERPAGRLPTIPASEAGKHVGERAIVCGRVVSARYVPRVRGRPTFLNFEKPYPRQLFTVVIWSEARARFRVPPEEAYEGREVCVEGTIDRYRGTPQIVVEDPRQIRARAEG